jgi:outer membrane protein assembly factor BamB
MNRSAIIIGLIATCVPAAAAAGAADWPQFHGPNRDNRSADTGLLKAWPKGGPPRLWETRGIGEGYSSVAIAGGRIHATGSIDGDCVITVLDMDGETVWTRKNGRAWAKPYPGTRSTPTIADGNLYHLSGIGNLVCLDADDGRVVWATDIMSRFGGRNIHWGLAESPLVVGDTVFCTPGGSQVSMVALDRKTGRTVWQCTGAGDRPGYASPILIDYQGLRQIVTVMSESVVGVRASDGKLLWRYPHKVYADENITTPLFRDGVVIVSGCGRKGTTALRLNVSGDECSVTRHWHNPTLDNKQGGIVLVGGRIYGYAEQLNRSTPWVCIDFATGRDVFRSAPVESSYKYRNGCLTYADERFYLYSDDGKMVLAKATDDGFEVTGRLTIAEPGKRPTWAHPVVCGGRLYVRYGDRLGVYDVSARGPK